MNKLEKRLKLLNSDCVEHIWFGWRRQITCLMALTDELCEVHKRHSGIYLGMNSKQCEDGRNFQNIRNIQM